MDEPRALLGHTTPRDAASRRHVVLVSALLLGAVACGKGSGPTQTEEGDGDVESGLSRVECPGLSFAATTGLPLDEIPIGALPSTFDDPVAAAVSVDGASHAGIAFVRADEPDGSGGGGELRLIVPLHPSTPLDGGVVRLEVSDGVLACAPVSFTIQPLPKADGELAAVVDLLEGVLAEQAAAFEITLEDLASTPVQDLPPGLWPLAMAQAVLDHPVNSRSLRAVAQGASGDEALDWVDRLLARTEVRSALETEAQLAARAGPAPVSAFQCLPEAIGPSAELLDLCMSAATQARLSASGAGRKVVDGVGKALNVAGERGVPVAKVAGTVFGFMSWLVYTEVEKAAALFPSRFTAMDVELDRYSFLEDEEAQGRVSRAVVLAASEGYDLQKEILEGIEQAASLSQETAQFDFSTGTIADDVAPEVRKIAEARAGDVPIEELHIESETFGPVDVTDPPWVQARVAAGEAIALIPGTTSYRPELWGMATLSVRTADGRFGGQQIFTDTDVTVQSIALSFMPSDSLVPASDPEAPDVITFELKVDDSVSPDSVELDLSDHPRQGAAEIRVTPGGDTHYVDYVAPVAPNYDEPDLLIVRHTARSGARENGPERVAIATVRFASITISPSSACIEPGAQQTFEADVVGMQNEEVTWSADIGEMDGNVYTAPADAAPGTQVTIRAVSVEDPQLDAEVTIVVGGCTCTFDVVVGGSTEPVQSGFEASYSAAEGLGDIITVIRLENPESGRMVSFYPDGVAEGMGAPGDYPIRIDGNFGLSGDDFAYFTTSSSDPPAVATLTIQEYEPGTVLRGFVDGSVRVAGPPPDYVERTVPFSASFAINIPADYVKPLPGPYGTLYLCTVP